MVSLSSTGTLHPEEIPICSMVAAEAQDGICVLLFGISNLGPLGSLTASNDEVVFPVRDLDQCSRVSAGLLHGHSPAGDVLGESEDRRLRETRGRPDLVTHRGLHLCGVAPQRHTVASSQHLSLNPLRSAQETDQGFWPVRRLGAHPLLPGGPGFAGGVGGEAAADLAARPGESQGQGGRVVGVGPHGEGGIGQGGNNFETPDFRVIHPQSLHANPFPVKGTSTIKL